MRSGGVARRAAYPPELVYGPTHDWARVEGEVASFGITWFAQDVVGEVVCFYPPAVGARVTQGGAYAEIESVKAVSEVVAPLSGTVLAVNDALVLSPEAINDDPYVAGWLVRVALSSPDEVPELLAAAEYEELLGDAR